MKLAKMKKLSKAEMIVLYIGGILMLAGAITYIFLGMWAAYIFIVGSLAYTSMQFLQRYEGQSLTIRRLRRIQNISCILILFAGVLMLINFQYIYIQWLNWGYYVRNEWLLSLFIGAVLHLYTAFRIPNELAKEEKNAKS
jgi:hypothetical protein